MIHSGKTATPRVEVGPILAGKTIPILLTVQGQRDTEPHPVWASVAASGRAEVSMSVCFIDRPSTEIEPDNLIFP